MSKIHEALIKMYRERDAMRKRIDEYERWIQAAELTRELLETRWQTGE